METRERDVRQKLLKGMERAMGFEPHSVAGSALKLDSRLLHNT
jgi:hypothetical protein